MLKLILKNKKNYFNVFLNKKQFEKQPLPQYQKNSFKSVFEIFFCFKLIFLIILNYFNVLMFKKIF
jgi:hypothetical protein